MLRLRRFFTTIKKDQIVNSTYQQLVDRIAKNYNLKQYKNQSGLCLLQMHHQFKLFKPGDKILDIGSGINYAWTDLSLKLTSNEESSNKVISNDILDLRKNRQNNVFIHGDIRQEPVLTKIALEIGDSNLDTILVDVSPQFTGNVNRDGRQIMEMITGVMQLSQNFLKKGGNFVCKILESQSQALIDETFQIFFHEKYKYVPSIIRKTSPVCFYVMKGFLMSQNYIALGQLIREYRGSPERKIKVVQKYQGKYSWDPIKVIKKQSLNKIIKLQNQGKSQKDILKIFTGDPYFNAEKILKLLKRMQQARKDRNGVLQSKLMNQLTEGQLFKNAQQFPTSAEQFYETIVQNMDKIVKQSNQRKQQKKNKQPRAPLKENQTYMKVQNNIKKQQNTIKQYKKADLQGKYSQISSKDQINQEIGKIQSIHPELKNLVSQFEQADKPNSQKTIEEIININKKRYDQMQIQKLREIQQQVQQSIRNMSNEDIVEQKKFQRQMQKQGYLQNRVQKEDRWINQRRSTRKKPLF